MLSQSLIALNLKVSNVDFPKMWPVPNVDFPKRTTTKVTQILFIDYRIDPKFSDRYAWANSADPDQTAPRGAV